MKKNALPFLKAIFFLNIGVFLIWLVVKDLTEEDKISIYKAFGQADYFWVILSLVLGFCSHLSRAARWKMLLQPLGFNPKLANTFCAVMIGYLANFALPRLGEVTRCGILTKYEKIPFTESFGTVIAERAIDLLFLILIFLATLFTQFDIIYGFAANKILIPAKNKFEGLLHHRWFALLLLVVAVLLIIAFYFIRKKLKGGLLDKLKNLAGGFVEGLKSVKNVKKPILFIAHSIFIWLMYYLMIHVCFFIFPETSHLGIGEALAVLIFGSLGIIFVPGGTGAYQTLVIETLALYAIPFTVAFAFAWIVWTSSLVLILFLGLLSLILLPIINKDAKAGLHTSENSQL